MGALGFARGGAPRARPPRRRARWSGTPPSAQRRMTRSARSASSSAWTHASRPIAIAARSPSATATPRPLRARDLPRRRRRAGRRPRRSRLRATARSRGTARRSAGTGSRGASVRSASSASARILATPSLTTERAQEGQPGVDRSAAVGQAAVVARRVRPRAARRSASAGRPQIVASSAPSTATSRVALERPVCLQPLEPALGGRDAAALIDRSRTLLDQSRHAVDVAGLLRVADRPLRLSVRLAPVGRSREEAWHEIRFGARQLGSEQFLEQVVVAVPLPVTVQRHQEQVGPRQRLQCRRGCRSPPGPRRTAAPTAARERRSG